MTSVDEDGYVLLPASWADSVEEDLYKDETPHSQPQVGVLIPEQLLLNTVSLQQSACLLLLSWQISMLPDDAHVARMTAYCSLP